MRRIAMLLIMLFVVATVTACTGSYGHRSDGTTQTRDEPPGGGY